jgi:hypothetical protein
MRKSGNIVAYKIEDMGIWHKTKKDTKIVKIFRRKVRHPFQERQYLYADKANYFLPLYSIEIVTPPSK